MEPESLNLVIRYFDEKLAPMRANFADAGLDLRASDTYTLNADERVLVGTGVKVKIPRNHVGILVPRSSLSKSGIIMTNSIGIIDSDYRGEIMASLMFLKTSKGDFFKVINKYDRIVQLVVVPIVLPGVVRDTGTEEDWFDTLRGAGGFGSTGN